MDSRVAGFVDSRHYDENEALALAPGDYVNYYIDGTNGNDGWDGLYPDHSQGGNHGPKKTFTYDPSNGKYGLLNNYINPGGGTRIIVRAGIYREMIDIPWRWGTSEYGGTPLKDEDHRMMIGPYGDGEVIIENSLTKYLGAWSAYDSNIYQSTLSVSTQVGTVVINDNFKSYRSVASLAAVTSFGKWYWDSNTHILYVHTNGNDPTDDDVIVIEYDTNGGSANYGCYFLNNSYWTLYGLTFRGSALGISGYGIYGNHINVDKCKFEFNQRAAIQMPSFSYNKYTKNYFKGNIIRNWPRGNHGWIDTDGGWPSNIYMGSYNTVSGNIILDAGGEGVNGGYYTTVEDNIFCDGFSVDIYTDNNKNNIYRRNIAITTNADPTDLINQTGSNWQKVRRKLMSIGVGLGDEWPPGQCGSHQIYDNIFISKRYGVGWGDSVSGSSIHDNKIYNNLIILPSMDTPTILDLYCAGFYFVNNIPASNSEIKNNIVIGNHSSGSLFVKSYAYSGLTHDYNLYYHPNRATPFNYLGASYNFANWQSHTGQDTNSLNIDPLLNNSDWSDMTSLVKNDFKLQATSPAINTGLNLGAEYAFDYDNNVRPLSGLWDLGAFEYYYEAPPTVTANVGQGFTAKGATFR